MLFLVHTLYSRGMAHELEDGLFGYIAPDVEPHPEELLHNTPDFDTVIEPGFLGRSQAHTVFKAQQFPEIATPDSFDSFDGSRDNLSAAPLAPGETVAVPRAFGQQGIEVYHE